ncbi:hypothetical protein C7445_11357 [Alicyclobacillus sacchari]|uniref:Ribosomal protein L14E/L6E/L27E n=1 Tax=Alicyclobacillus sacchari TaxID=392010 RepID=A0A4R8LHW0_9BACL|nr:KOW domain-containing RNA-binding protein [Alicyclobacillus sacchari]TDY42823.1 hypothetical protein C7445_11357 [Alicyclobacillus sacchari]GMA57021.1 hypothetical protein GCM10025858_15240 [Alicyclobacillus sacchari]
MSVPRELPPLGSLVEVMQGRDAGLVAVVIGHLEDRFILVADGSVRRADRPKKKNVLHVRRLSHIASEVEEKLRIDGKVTNALLRHTVRMFLEERLAAANQRDQGGAFHGEG